MTRENRDTVLRLAITVKTLYRYLFICLHRAPD